MFADIFCLKNWDEKSVEEKNLKNKNVFDETLS